MMNNLFSIFDTNTNTMLELNWISSFLIISMIPTNYWILNSRITKIIKNLLMIILNELSIIFKNKFNSLNMIFFSTLLMFILLNNFMGLYPYIFTSSSHFIFSISFSLPLWLGLMLFSSLNTYNSFFAHMIPQGTPTLLMPFMVLIESISNLIRPGTLTIRLTANMIAGHILLSLLSNSASSSLFFIMLLITFTQTILLTLEFSVSIIQSYVFTILSTLYTKETN